VLEAQGSVMTNKYAEGYPGRRYYGGCQFVDIAEKLAIERACRLFGCSFANVQPNSGSQANQAVFMALMQPGDTFMGLDLAAGGHLTHGAPVNQSGKWFNVVSYGVCVVDQMIDYDGLERLAVENKPKVIVAGGSAYARTGISPASARSPTRSAPISWSTSPISPGSSPVARIPRRSRTPMSSPPRRTRPCAARAAA
jgi:glycine hydroxymethyltransferase